LHIYNELHCSAAPGERGGGVLNVSQMQQSFETRFFETRFLKLFHLHTYLAFANNYVELQGENSLLIKAAHLKALPTYFPSVFLIFPRHGVKPVPSSQ